MRLHEVIITLQAQTVIIVVEDHLAAADPMEAVVVVVEDLLAEAVEEDNYF
jgi:hypothetical protein